jgi:hypothetical protein
MAVLETVTYQILQCMRREIWFHIQTMFTLPSRSVVVLVIITMKIGHNSFSAVCDGILNWELAKGD